MPRKAKKTDKVLKQQTLTSFIHSSPQRGLSSPTNSKSHKPPIGSQRTGARKPEPACVPVDNIDNEDSDGDTSDVIAIRFEPDVIELSDDASPRRPTSQHRGARPTQAHGIKLDDDGDELFSGRSDGSGYESRKKVRLGKRKQVVELSDSEEEDIQPRRRKLIKGTRPPSVNSGDEDLMEEVEEHRILQKRMRTRDKKTIFQKNLEKLKRKKRGLAAQSSSEESANSEDEEGPLRSSSVVPFAGAKPHISDGDESSEDESQDEDTFIVDDDAAAAELPPEFSMDTHQDLAHQFKIICQFFVHIAVQKPKERHSYMEDAMKNTKYFSVPLQIARRKLSGLRDSLVASSVWRPDFKNQLQRYPNFALMSLGIAIPACDACHLGGRLSTLLGRVSGDPYDRMGFKPLDVISSNESESDEDEERPSKEFHLGRFCAKRTEVFHGFTHWEHALFENLEREVDELRHSGGSRGFVRVAFSKGIKPPEDLTDADGIMDWLDERGIIDMEWQTIRELMESARNLEMMASKRGENDIAFD